MSQYYAPAFRVEINGSRLASDVSKNIQEVHVTSKPDTLDTFSFTVANSLPHMRWTHTGDADIFKEGSAVKISMGYVDDMSEVIEGEITKIQPSFPQSSMPTVAIEGYTRLHRLQGNSKTRTFQQTSDKQIAEKIAEEAGLQAEVEDAGLHYDYVMQANQSDLAFLRDRASRIHFEVLVNGKTLKFRKAKENTSRVFTLLWAQAQKSFASTSNTLPLKSFTPEMDTLQPVSQTEYRSYDPSSKKAFVSRASVSDQPTSMGGKAKGADVWMSAFQRPRSYVHVTTPFNSQAEGDQLSKAKFNESAMNLVKGTAETIGIPELRSGQVVELAGLGPRFSGLYYVDEATHSIDGNGYATHFTVKRNSV